jgi:hypothetical protein
MGKKITSKQQMLNLLKINLQSDIKKLRRVKKTLSEDGEAE